MRWRQAPNIANEAVSSRPPGAQLAVSSIVVGQKVEELASGGIEPRDCRVPDQPRGPVFVVRNAVDAHLVEDRFIVKRLSVPLLASALEPVLRAREVDGHPDSLGVHDAQLVLDLGVPIECCHLD